MHAKAERFNCRTSRAVTVLPSSPDMIERGLGPDDPATGQAGHNLGCAALCPYFSMVEFRTRVASLCRYHISRTACSFLP